MKDLATKGVKYSMKSMRNLRKEGPTTQTVAAKADAHHFNTRDLNDQVKNSWLL
jgi:hypothetical protein